jgi:hypothetical protein
MNLQTDTDDLGVELVYIKLIPEPTVFCYGLGYGLMELRSGHTEASYKVAIPAERW